MGMIIACESKITSDDISNCEKDIREEYTKRGIYVVEVMMIAESSNKMTGYAKIKLNGVSITKTCNATAGKSNNGERMFIWNCQ